MTIRSMTRSGQPHRTWMSRSVCILLLIKRISLPPHATPMSSIWAFWSLFSRRLSRLSSQGCWSGFRGSRYFRPSMILAGSLTSSDGWTGPMRGFASPNPRPCRCHPASILSAKSTRHSKTIQSAWQPVGFWARTTSCGRPITRMWIRPGLTLSQ